MFIGKFDTFKKFAQKKTPTSGVFGFLLRKHFTLGFHFHVLTLFDEFRIRD
jgi:hypothetical protein